MSKIKSKSASLAIIFVCLQLTIIPQILTNAEAYTMGTKVNWNIYLEHPTWMSSVTNDIDKDGITELIYIDYETAIRCITYTNDELATKWATPFYELIYSQLFSVDLDNDDYFELLFISNDDKLHCLNHEGNELWSYNTSLNYYSTLVVANIDDNQNHEIILSNENDTLICLNSFGNELWSTKLDDCVNGIPKIADINSDTHQEILFGIGLESDIFCCLSNEGEFLWNFTADERVANSPIAINLDDDLTTLEIVFSTTNGTLYCLNSLGQEVWSSSLSTSDGLGNPVASDLTNDGKLEILIDSPNNLLYCVNNEGNLLWKYNTGWGSVEYYLEEYFISVADLDSNGKLEILHGKYSNEDFGGIICLNYKGKVLWKYDVKGTIRNSIVVADLNNDAIPEIIFNTWQFINCLSITNLSLLYGVYLLPVYLVGIGIIVLVIILRKRKIS